MKNILWYQDPNNNSQDVISIDGEIITPPTHPTYIKYYNILQDFNTQTFNKNIANIYKLKTGYFVKGHLADKDVMDRNIGFMFYSDAKNTTDLADNLKRELQVNDKKCTDKLIEQIQAFRTSKTSYFFFTILISIIIASLLIILYKNQL